MAKTAPGKWTGIFLENLPFLVVVALVSAFTCACSESRMMPGATKSSGSSTASSGASSAKTDGTTTNAQIEGEKPTDDTEGVPGYLVDPAMVKVLRSGENEQTVSV